MTKRQIIIATRESKLALYQANWVKQRLLTFYPTLQVELLGMTTEGDKQLKVPLTAIGGKSLFVKELEEALFLHRADIAVHSMKDVPMQLPVGLNLPVICEREDARDSLISEKFASFSDLPKGAIVGTSSLRRQTQLSLIRADINFKAIRGNIHTRLNYLQQGKVDALVLAAAGLNRLQEAQRICSFFSPEELLPAAGQGALGIECREDDVEMQQFIQPLLHANTYAAVSAERALCRFLGGGCHVPLAAYAYVDNNQLHLKGLIANRDGKKLICGELVGELNQAENLGYAVGELMSQQGVAEILKEFQ